MNKLIDYLRENLDKINLRKIGFTLEGIFLIYELQYHSLEKDTKVLLALLNGDALWEAYRRTLNPNERKEEQKTR